MPRSTPAYTRLDVDERRRRLLELGAELFTLHAYDELSMAAVARAAGISKALLYHYFPSKQAFFMATLEQKASELSEVIRTDPDRTPLEQLSDSLDAYLRWVEGNAAGYAKLTRSAGAVPEVRELVEAVRALTAERVLSGLVGDETPSPALATAVHAWLWFLDGACLDWIEREGLERDALRDLLVGTLLGAVSAAGGPFPG